MSILLSYLALQNYFANLCAFLFVKFLTEEFFQQIEEEKMKNYVNWLLNFAKFYECCLIGLYFRELQPLWYPDAGTSAGKWGTTP